MIGWIVLIIICIVGLFYFLSLQKRQLRIKNLENKIKDLETDTIRVQEEWNIAQKNAEFFRNQLIEKAVELDEKNKELNQLNLEVANKKHSMYQEILNEQAIADQKIEQINQSIDDTRRQEEKIKAELEDFRLRRQALNRVLLEEEKKRAEKEPHSIWLSEEAKQDIDYLFSILPNLSNQEILLKLVWTTYIQKPLNDMLHRICGSSTPRNVVYMIKNLENQKIYIGKTTDYMERMKQHVKSSLSIGTISHQKVHDALFKNWDKFYFDIIESDVKNLNEREKYYIQMFESDVYGYNMKG